MELLAAIVIPLLYGAASIAFWWMFSTAEEL